MFFENTTHFRANFAFKRAPQMINLGAYDHDSSPNSRSLFEIFRISRASTCGEFVAHSVKRSHAHVHGCGHGSIQGLLFGCRQARLFACYDFAKVRACWRQTQRSRERWLHLASPYVLRNARQLFVRRLFQARRDSLCLGIFDEGFRFAQRKAARFGSHLRRRVGKNLGSLDRLL